MIFGGVNQERLQLNEGTFWAGGSYDPVNPEAKAALPEVRQLLNDGKYREAARRLNANLRYGNVTRDVKLAKRRLLVWNRQYRDRESVWKMTNSPHSQSRQSSQFGGLLTATILSLASLQPNLFAADAHWVATWGCSVQLTEPNNLPPVPLANSTLRQFVRASVGGKKLRVHLSNIFGTDSVILHTVHIALAAVKGSAGSGEINPATDKALTFNGAAEVMIPKGELVLSDAVDFDLPALADVSVSIYFGDVSATTVTGHPGSRTTSFIVASNEVSAASLPDAKKTAHWYLITGIEVQTDNSGKTIAVLGDSITDGRGSTTDGNNRWPDVLAQRLITNAPTAKVGVVNMGVGGNAIFGGLGPAAIKRFDRDVLEQSGVRYFILFEGVNDIGARNSSMNTATNLVSAYAAMASQAKARGIRAYAATLTPFGGSGYYSDLHEQERQYVNAWLRTNTVFDGVIDFDAAVRDPVTVTNFQSAYHPGPNANDWLHLNPSGYKALGDGIDLQLFAP
jgi:lysophospholipase L1-like esterase